MMGFSSIFFKERTNLNLYDGTAFESWRMQRRVSLNV